MSESLLRQFEEVTGIKRKPEWIKQQAFQDFGISLDTVEDISKLDKYVRANFYEDKAEWLKEKMRDAIREQDSLLEEINERLEQQIHLHDPRLKEANVRKIQTLLNKSRHGTRREG